MTSFSYTAYGGQVIFGVGTLAQVGEAVAGFGWRRLMLCSSPSLRPAGHIAPLEAALGERLVAKYEGTQAHVLDYQLAEALEMALASDVDAVIGLGGGSCLGMAKAVSAALKRAGTPVAQQTATARDRPQVAVVAIPTTYAGSEMTPVYGVTHHQGGISRKVTVQDVKIVPQLVIYDPALTLSLPLSVTAGTGINALAHCLEALYSVTRHPLSTAAALSGIRHISRALPHCVAKGDDMEARTELLLGAHLAGTAGVPHGVANGIMLPHALWFNRDVAAAELAAAAEALGLPRGENERVTAEGAIVQVRELIGQIGLPQRLRDVGVAEADLPKLAGVGNVPGTDILHFNGSGFELYFDGSDVGLTKVAQEKIDGLHILDGSVSPIGGSCTAYLLISTFGTGKVPAFGGGTLNFQGEDILGFCATNVGPDGNTAGFWHMVLDGSDFGMPKNSTDSLSASNDGSLIYLTTKGPFNVDSASGGHSMVYLFESGSFSGPFFSAPANGLNEKVDSLHVEGDLP